MLMPPSAKSTSTMYGQMVAFEESATSVGANWVGVSVGIGAAVGGGLVGLGGGVSMRVGVGVSREARSRSAGGVFWIAPATAESSLEKNPGWQPLPARTIK